MGVACLGTILALCCPAQPQAPAEKASISGVVTSATGEPLKGATLRLTPVLSSRIPSADAAASNSAVETDSQGNFVFDEVEPGRYLLAAERTGYLGSSFNDARGGVLTVRPGGRVTGIVVKMAPQGIIAGRVVDDEDEPVPGANVTLNGYGRPMGAGTTNADGVFAIGNLPPGRYIVSAAPPPAADARIKTPPGSPQEAYVPIYYPDAVDASAATPVELSAGGQARGLEIRLHKVPVFRVSGTVVNPATGEPGPAEILSLIHQGGAPPLSARSTGVNAGEFSFDGVLPGAYILETKTAVESGDRAPLVGWQTIAVGNGDLDRVVVEMKPGIEVRGNVIVEGAPLVSWPQLALTPAEGLNYPLDFAAIDENGRFRVTGLEPAPYRVSVGGIRPPLFLKSIRFNGRDIANEPIDLASSSVASLEIVISDRAGSISGVVSDSDGPVGPAVMVMAQLRGMPGPARIAPTEENGRFTFRSLPPGEYFLTAMDTGSRFFQLPPEIVENVGKAVTVGEGASVSADLRLTTAESLRLDAR